LLADVDRSSLPATSSAARLAIACVPGAVSAARPAHVGQHARLSVRKFVTMPADHPVVLCDRCRGPTNPSTFVQPLGNIPGARVYDCTACGHSTWREWRLDSSVPPQQQTPRQSAQLQQQQPQTKKEPDDGANQT